MTNQATRIYAPIFIAIAIIFSIFWLKPIYTQYMDTRWEIAQIKSAKEEKQRNLDALVSLKQLLENSTDQTELTEKVKKLSNTWVEADILSSIMLNQYTRWTDFVSPPISINSITIDEGKKLPSWLSLGTVQFTVLWKTVDDIIGFLTYLTSNTWYIYTLDSISLPISAPVQEDVWWVSLPVTLGVYYYQ
jgi:hypothetical protein